MSALRAALIGVFEMYYPETNWRGQAPTSAPAGRVNLVDDLVAAVEGVPVQVTIRDLDMSDPVNIVTVDGDGLQRLYEVAEAAYLGGHPMHLTVDAGDLKVKVGGYTWSAPIKTEVYEG